MIYLKFDDPENDTFSIWQMNDKFQEKPFYYSEGTIDDSISWDDYDEDRCYDDIEHGYKITVLTYDEAFLEIL